MLSAGESFERFGLNELVDFDNSGLFAERVVLDSFAKSQSQLKDISLHCLDYEQFDMVYDNEILDRHAGHDMDVVYSVYDGYDIRKCHWSVRFDVDREEVFYWRLDDIVTLNDYGRM